MSNAILEISDGTTTIDLIHEVSGFILVSWRPAISGYKGGGTFQNSPLTYGRQLVDRQYANVIETMTLKARNVTENTLIHDLQELRRLLEKAATYWSSDWQTEPVWIKAQSPNETNPRWSIIQTGQIPEDEKPYGQPFMQPDCAAMMNDLTLVIERQPFWWPVQPGTGTATPLCAKETYNSIPMGNVDFNGTVCTPSSVEGEVFIANKRNVANITNVHYWDSVGGAWSGNLHGNGLANTLLPIPPATGDVLLIGINTALADSGPFASAVFNLLPALTVTTAVWRYSRGAADPTGWPALTIQDNTDAAGAMTGHPLDTAGVGSVHWEQPNDWAVFDPAVGVGPALGTTGYWIALHITNAGGGPVAPVQQTRDIYSVIWEYTEIQDTTVLGGVIAIAQLRIRNQSDNNASAAPETWSNRVICGLRSVSRGANFTSYLNFADEQNPANIAVAVAGTGAFATFTRSPTGRIITATPAAGGFIDTAQISINNPLSTEYPGVYHGFLRLETTAGGTSANIDVQVRAIYGAVPGSIIYESETLTMDATGGDVGDVLDLGKIAIPDFISGAGTTSFAFIVALQGDGATVVRLMDLILIPVDEWSMDVLSPVISNTGAFLGARRSLGGRYLDIDPITKPKRVEPLLKNFNNDTIRLRYRYIGPNGSPILQANTVQRLHFFQTARDQTNEEGDLWIADTLTINRVQQYLSLRGDR